MAEASSTTRRSLFAITAGLALTPAALAYAAPTSIDALDRRLARHFEAYDPEDADDTGEAWSAELSRIESQLAAAPCTSARAAEIKLRNLILPTCEAGSSSNVNDAKVVEDIIAWLRTV